MISIRQTFYISCAMRGADDRTAQAILGASRVNNWRLDLTGLLMFTGTHFAQLLEGQSSAVQLMLDKIGRDRRHDAVRILVDRHVTLRGYGDWSMGYLYKSGLAAAVERLAQGAEVDAGEVAALLEGFHPDTVMGSL